ncbi:histidinol-phosphate aminotransferase family protein [Rhodocytophaga rosea]|uniref:Histidinol-phosphate aminotransferase family protein n=1 Tax=Rhodocytophaga rosea TaxID=2704465 RepID=A0A6C0GL90_9BACT|nr:histidinol-phosphate transaminase [Rhodocytophaga rosea]QHT68584.1 histidinol-phosphate aminotransferase family protein [Rhodocytophaga rosea]
MASQVNRRNWLKSSALMAAGLTMGTSRWHAANAEMITARQLFAKAYETEARLAADMPVIKARLFANENPFGPSEKAKKAIVEALPESYMYPFMQLREFASLIAKEEGVSEDHILLGAGSSELLMACSYLYGANGGSIVSADPSYAYLMETAGTFGAKWEKVPLTKDYAHDLDAMEKRVTDKTSLVYICNPNNPTGTIVSAIKLASFCEVVSKKKPVFVDEAYIDYIPDSRKNSMINAVKKGQNVIVARTFSKVHGFAGLRIGYVIALPETIKKIEKYGGGGMNITATSVKGAIASFTDMDHITYAVGKNKESKDFLYTVLKDEGYEYIPSYGNFVMFPLKMDGKKFRDEMMKRGVGIRNWEFNKMQWCRVSMGTMEQMQLFAQAFKELS